MDAGGGTGHRTPPESFEEGWDSEGRCDTPVMDDQQQQEQEQEQEQEEQAQVEAEGVWVCALTIARTLIDWRVCV